MKFLFLPQCQDFAFDLEKSKEEISRQDGLIAFLQQKLQAKGSPAAPQATPTEEKPEEKEPERPQGGSEDGDRSMGGN
jgi:hypothetical protein